MAFQKTHERHVALGDAGGIERGEKLASHDSAST